VLSAESAIKEIYAMTQGQAISSGTIFPLDDIFFLLDTVRMGWFHLTSSDLDLLELLTDQQDPCADHPSTLDIKDLLANLRQID
jgi:hypothetical protein